MVVVEPIIYMYLLFEIMKESWILYSRNDSEDQVDLSWTLLIILHQKFDRYFLNGERERERDSLVNEVEKKERFIWKKVKESTRRRENGRVDLMMSFVLKFI